MYTLPQPNHFLYFSLHSTEGYSKYKTKVKAKNNLMELKESKGSFTYNICLKKERNSSLPFFDQKY